MDSQKLKLAAVLFGDRVTQRGSNAEPGVRGYCVLGERASGEPQSGGSGLSTSSGSENARLTRILERLAGEHPQISRQGHPH